MWMQNDTRCYYGTPKTASHNILNKLLTFTFVNAITFVYMYLYVFSETNETSPIIKEAGRKEGSTQQTTSPLIQSMPTFRPIDTYLTQYINK